MRNQPHTADRPAPFANCAFRHCDLPGQCTAEGACHHPARVNATETEPIWWADAARDVLAERARQVSVEGWTPTHDDQHDDGVLVCAAIAYAGADTINYPINEPPDMWPWAREWWKPSDDRRNLVKAAALLVAEIERLDRAGPRADAQDGEQ